MKFTQKEIDTFNEIIDDEYEAYLNSYMLDASLEDFDDFINSSDFSKHSKYSKNKKDRLIEFYRMKDSGETVEVKGSKSPRSSRSSRSSHSSHSNSTSFSYPTSSPHSSKSSSSKSSSSTTGSPRLGPVSPLPHVEFVSEEDMEEFDRIYGDYLDHYSRLGVDDPTDDQVEIYIDSHEKQMTPEFRERFLRYTRSERKFRIKSLSPSPRADSERSSMDSTELVTGKKNSKYTLLLNCCHGELPVENKKKLEHIKNPISHLNRLIQGAQLCFTYMDRKDVIDIFSGLTSHSYNTLNDDNIDTVKKIILGLNAVKEHSNPTTNIDLLHRKNQFHNTLQFVKTRVNEYILNKEWSINYKPVPKTTPHNKVEDVNGLYFVCETTFVVPYDIVYVDNPKYDNSHFNFQTNQITYPAFYNILTCPIFQQYNNWMLDDKYPHGVPVYDDWAYVYGIRDVAMLKMIYETNAYSLYHYLSEIPHVSMIDNSCESHSLYNEVRKLKVLRESYRKLGPKVGKKLVRETTKKIYRMESQLKSKARGKKTNKKRKQKRRTRKQRSKKI